MKNQPLHTLAEFPMVLKTREDIALLSRIWARSLNPAFFDAIKGENYKPLYERADVLRVLTYGTQFSGKSIIADEVEDEVLPRGAKEIPLSGYGYDELSQMFRSNFGESNLYDGKLVEISFSDCPDESVLHLGIKVPSIRFDQNVEPIAYYDPAVSFELRSPRPENIEDHNIYHRAITALEELEGDTSKKAQKERAESLLEQELYGFADPKKLEEAGLSEIFEEAVQNNAPMPTFLTLRIHSDTLINDRTFAPFIEMLENIKEHPAHASQILAEEYARLSEDDGSRPSARSAPS